MHTKGYDGQKGSVNEVLIDIITSLQERPAISILNDKIKSRIDDALDEWEIEDPSIREDLINSVSTLDLLFLINKFGSNLSSGCFDYEVLDVFHNIFDQKPDNINISKILIFKWISSEKLHRYADQFNNKTSKFFDWGTNENHNWIKTEDLFITVLGKKTHQSVTYRINFWRLCQTLNHIRTNLFYQNSEVKLKVMVAMLQVI